MDLPNSSYEFYKTTSKSAFKSPKPKYGSLTRGTRGVNGPTGQREQSIGAAVDPRLLTSGEDSGEAKGTGVLASTSHT